MTATRLERYAAISGIVSAVAAVIALGPSFCSMLPSNPPSSPSASVGNPPGASKNASSPNVESSDASKATSGASYATAEAPKATLGSTGVITETISIPDFSTGWIEGQGKSTPYYCDPRREVLENKYPGYHIKMTYLPEQHKENRDWIGIKHDRYMYGCSFTAIKK